MKARRHVAAIPVLMVFLSLVVTVLRSPLFGGINQNNAGKGESVRGVTQIFAKNQNAKKRSLAATKSRSDLSRNESRVRSHLALGEAEVGCLRVSRDLLKTFEESGEDLTRVFRAGKEELIAELKKSEHIGLVSGVACLKKFAEENSERLEQFQLAEQTEMPRDIEESSWASVMADDPRKPPGFGIEGKELILPSGERRVSFRYRHSYVSEWIQLSNGETVPRISETSMDTQMRIADDQVIVIPPADDVGEGWVLFFGD